MSKKREILVAAIVATMWSCVGIGLCLPVVSSGGGKYAPAVADRPTVSFEAQSPDSGLDLRLVFYGYPKIGVPRSGAAIISEAGLLDVHDITFNQTGGELSPNGRLIAYDNCSSPNRGIYLAEPDGSKAQMVKNLAGHSCLDLRWSPDGTKLSYDSPPDQSLHILDIASKIETVIPNTQGADWHSWSPAGNQIVYGRMLRGAPVGRSLYITDLSGNIRQLTFAKDFPPCDREPNRIDTWAPAWSPKGDKIAFTQCGRLFVVSPTGNALRQLTTPQHDSLSSAAMPVSSAYGPRWSPDGRWLIFIGEGICRIGGDSVIKRISSDGKTIVEIGRLPYCGGPFSIAPFNK